MIALLTMLYLVGVFHIGITCKLGWLGLLWPLSALTCLLDLVEKDFQSKEASDGPRKQANSSS